jgi:hypothetical protein
MARTPVEPRDLKKNVQIRLRIEEHTRLRYAFDLTGEPSISEWLKPHLLAMADRVIAEKGRSIEFGRAAPDGRKADVKARDRPRKAM